MEDERIIDLYWQRSQEAISRTAGFARKFLSISYPTRRTRKNACLIHTWPYGTAFPHSGQRVFRLLRQPLSEISA